MKTQFPNGCEGLEGLGGRERHLCLQRLEEGPFDVKPKAPWSPQPSQSADRPWSVPWPASPDLHFKPPERMEEQKTYNDGERAKR